MQRSGHAPAELLGHLVGQRLGALAVVRPHVDVDERPRAVAGDLHAEPVDVVVVALHGEERRAVDGGRDDLLLLQVGGHEDVALQAVRRGVGGDGVGQVAGRGAGHDPVAELLRLLERDRDDAVLEGVRRVGRVVLHPHVPQPEGLGQARGLHQRRHARSAGRRSGRRARRAGSRGTATATGGRRRCARGTRATPPRPCRRAPRAARSSTRRRTPRSAHRCVRTPYIGARSPPSCTRSPLLPMPSLHEKTPFCREGGEGVGGLHPLARISQVEPGGFGTWRALRWLPRLHRASPSTALDASAMISTPRSGSSNAGRPRLAAAGPPRRGATAAAPPPARRAGPPPAAAPATRGSTRARRPPRGDPPHQVVARDAALAADVVVEVAHRHEAPALELAEAHPAGPHGGPQRVAEGRARPARGPGRRPCACGQHRPRPGQARADTVTGALRPARYDGPHALMSTAPPPADETPRRRWLRRRAAPGDGRRRPRRATPPRRRRRGRRRRPGGRAAHRGRPRAAPAEEGPRQLRRRREQLLTEREETVYHLGGLAFELYRRDRLSDEVMRLRAGHVAQLDDEVRDIDARLSDVERERKERRVQVAGRPGGGLLPGVPHAVPRRGPLLLAVRHAPGAGHGRRRAADRRHPHTAARVSEERRTGWEGADKWFAPGAGARQGSGGEARPAPEPEEAAPPRCEVCGAELEPTRPTAWSAAPPPPSPRGCGAAARAWRRSPGAVAILGLGAGALAYAVAEDDGGDAARHRHHLHRAARAGDGAAAARDGPDRRHAAARHQPRHRAAAGHRHPARHPDRLRHGHRPGHRAHDAPTTTSRPPRRRPPATPPTRCPPRAATRTGPPAAPRGRRSCRPCAARPTPAPRSAA